MAKKKSTQRKDEVKKRLAEAVLAIEQDMGALPKMLGSRVEAIQGKSREMFDIGFGNNTLNRREYKPLWHPKFRDLP
jgi:hypothetical protein